MHVCGKPKRWSLEGLLDLFLVPSKNWTKRITDSLFYRQASCVSWRIKCAKWFRSEQRESCWGFTEAVFSTDMFWESSVCLFTKPSCSGKHCCIHLINEILGNNFSWYPILFVLLLFYFLSGGQEGLLQKEVSFLFMLLGFNILLCIRCWPCAPFHYWKNWNKVAIFSVYSLVSITIVLKI